MNQTMPAIQTDLQKIEDAIHRYQSEVDVKSECQSKETAALERINETKVSINELGSVLDAARKAGVAKVDIANTEAMLKSTQQWLERNMADHERYRNDRLQIENELVSNAKKIKTAIDLIAPYCTSPDDQARLQALRRNMES